MYAQPGFQPDLVDKTDLGLGALGPTSYQYTDYGFRIVRGISGVIPVAVQECAI